VRDHDTARVATVVATGLTGLAALQLVLAPGEPPGKAGWSGVHTEQPTGLRIGSAVSAVFPSVGAQVVLGRGGYRPGSGLPMLYALGARVMALLLGLSSLANFASASRWEQFLTANSTWFCRCCVPARGPSCRRTAASRVEPCPLMGDAGRSPRRRATPGARLNRSSCRRPDTGEPALKIMDTAIRSGALDIIVIDSDRHAVRLLQPRHGSRCVGCRRSLAWPVTGRPLAGC